VVCVCRVGGYWVRIVWGMKLLYVLKFSLRLLLDHVLMLLLHCNSLLLLVLLVLGNLLLLLLLCLSLELSLLLLDCLSLELSLLLKCSLLCHSLLLHLHLHLMLLLLLL